MLITYFLTQLSMDGYTRLKSASKDQVINYGIKETDTDVFTPGISSLLMFIIWFSVIFTRKLSLGLDILGVFRIAYPDLLNSVLQLLGMILVFFGVIVANWSRLLRGVNSPNWGFKESSKLITNGPYRYIRHPSYTFYILVTTGLAILTQIWFVYLIIWGVGQYSKVADKEEEMLVLQFGEAYIEYRLRSKKFIPLVW